MYEFGTTREQLGRIALIQRDNARLNANALLRGQLTMQAYLDARNIADPVHLYDCVMPCAGADAVVVVAPRIARRLGRIPLRILAGGEWHNHEPGHPVVLDTGLRRFSTDLFAEAGCSPSDLDFIQLYDDYPIMVLIQLEDLGFCVKGAGGELLQAQDFSRDGRTSLNTGGGQLSCGQAGASGGMIGAVEAVAQLQGEAGDRQINANLGLITGFGMVGYGRGLSSSAVVLAS
jgi:acetyl-CoA acetyltransferase